MERVLSCRLQWPPTGQRHVRDYRISPETTLNEVPHRMNLCLVGGNQPFAQQKLDMAVVAAARQHLSVPQMVDPAIADVRPPRGFLLDETNGASGAGALLDRQRHTELHDFLVCTAKCQMQKAERIEERLRNLCERIQNELLRDLGSLRAVRMTSHPIGNHQQHRLLGDRNGDPILVLLAPAQEADVGVVDPQEEFRASVRLSRALYHPAAT